MMKHFWSATIHEFSHSWFNEVENIHEKVKAICYRVLSTTIIKKLNKVIYFGRMEIIIFIQVSTGQYISEVASILKALFAHCQ